MQHIQKLLVVLVLMSCTFCSAQSAEYKTKILRIHFVDNHTQNYTYHHKYVQPRISQDEKISELTENQNSIYVKGNALFLPLLMPNIGVEYQLNEKYTLQGDVFISPWKSFGGKKAQVYMAGLEGRYYFDKAFQKWYIGANVSFSTFNIQKWTYWNVDYLVSKENPEIKYDADNYYQKGFSYLLGATLGYQFRWKDRWNVDVYLGAGTSQGFYRGYDEVSGQRIDELNSDKKRKFNRSGEFIPYRGGVMISYKIK